jgi:hypothetical protein
MANSADLTLKLFATWQQLLGKLLPAEKVLLELVVKQGGLTPAIDKWIEVSTQIEAGVLKPEDRLKALFGKDEDSGS